MDLAEQQTLDEIESNTPDDAPHPATINIDVPEEHIPEPADVEQSIEPPAPAPSTPVPDTELERAVKNMLEDMRPLLNDPKYQALMDLPQYLEEDDIPDVEPNVDPSKTGPRQDDFCPHCGARFPWSRPLERGRVIEREGEDGNPYYTPCARGKYNIETCTCCGCPDCGNKSIYERKNKKPKYACLNPRCDTYAFKYPIERFEDSDELRHRLYWECGECHKPIQAPFEGVPDEFFFEEGAVSFASRPASE